MVAHTGSALIAVFRVAWILAVFVALEPFALLVTAALIGLRMRLRLALTSRLPLLLSLIHRIQDTKVMLGMLEKCFRRHPVAAARRVAA